VRRICQKHLLVGLGVLLLHGAAAGQTNVEIRGGLAVGSHTGTAAGLDFAPSLSYQALVLRQMAPGLSVYGGYVHTAFGCEEGFCLDRDLTVVGNHAALGVEVRRGSPWLRLGFLFGATEVGTEGEAPDAGAGVHVGGGFTIGSGRVRFLPGVSYRWLTANTPSSSDHAVALALDLGVGIRLGSTEGAR
jgi:hypothetical protein